MKITFLGTGTSYGVPVIGCECEVCRSSSSRNKRLRSSLLITIDSKNILIDTTPDIRAQLLKTKIKHLDAILFTHYHADHILGLDDVRIFNRIQKTSIPCFALKNTIDTIKTIFEYAFNPNTPEGGGLPQLTLNIVKDSFDLFGTQITPVPILHGNLSIIGFKWKNFAYVTDCSFMPEDSKKLLYKINTLVLNGLRYRPHSTHYSISESLDVIKQIQPKRAYLTHISHDVDHENLKINLPDNVKIAYDRLTFKIND
ncbi:MBL fold metallo-hydrolase [bacterium]|nr:MBL fold metallo-hydrolase [bacterium]